MNDKQSGSSFTSSPAPSSSKRLRNSALQNTTSIIANIPTSNATASIYTTTTFSSTRARGASASFAGRTNGTAVRSTSPGSLSIVTNLPSHFHYNASPTPIAANEPLLPNHWNIQSSPSPVVSDSEDGFSELHVHRVQSSPSASPSISSVHDEGGPKSSPIPWTYADMLNMRQMTLQTDEFGGRRQSTHTHKHTQTYRDILTGFQTHALEIRE